MEESKWGLSSSQKFQMKILKLQEPPNKNIKASGMLQMKSLRI